MIQTFPKLIRLSLQSSVRKSADEQRTTTTRYPPLGATDSSAPTAGQASTAHYTVQGSFIGRCRHASLTDGRWRLHNAFSLTWRVPGPPGFRPMSNTIRDTGVAWDWHSIHRQDLETVVVAICNEQTETWQQLHSFIRLFAH